MYILTISVYIRFIRKKHR